MNFKIYKEFKEFAVKGNMIDIAVGVIIGAAFNKVVDAIVKEVLLPPLSLLTNGINLENKKFILREAVTTNGVTNPEEIAIGYGKLMEAGLDFLIISFTVFVMVKFINRLKDKANDPNNNTVKTPKDIELLNKISVLMEEQVSLLKKTNKH